MNEKHIQRYRYRYQQGRDLYRPDAHKGDDQISNSQIRELRAEAAAIGDELQVDICQIALGSQPHTLRPEYTVESARAECARVIAEAMAAEGDL